VSAAVVGRRERAEALLAGCTIDSGPTRAATIGEKREQEKCTSASRCRTTQERASERLREQSASENEEWTTSNHPAVNPQKRGHPQPARCRWEPEGTNVPVSQAVIFTRRPSTSSALTLKSTPMVGATSSNTSSVKRRRMELFPTPGTRMGDKMKGQCTR